MYWVQFDISIITVCPWIVAFVQLIPPLLFSAMLLPYQQDFGRWWKGQSVVAQDHWGEMTLIFPFSLYSCIITLVAKKPL